MNRIEASDHHSRMHDRVSHIRVDLLYLSDLTTGRMSLIAWVPGPFGLDVDRSDVYEAPEPSSRANFSRRRRWR